MTQTREEFVNQIKKTLHSQPIPPNYNANEWKGKDFNCYAYALRICLDLSAHDKIWPGFISRGELENDYRNTRECTLQYFKDDCEALGLQVFPTTISEKIGTSEYKIAVYVHEGMDFHFARQDSDGNWSEKDCWDGEIKFLETDDVTKDEDGYQFIGVFRVSKKAG